MIQSLSTFEIVKPNLTHVLLWQTICLIKKSELKATMLLECLAGEKQHRMKLAKEMLSHLYGRDARWEAIKRKWRKSVLYPCPKDRMKKEIWLLGASIVALIGMAFYSYIGFTSS